jgi:predicted MPP superfamily phosphohydrolase
MKRAALIALVALAGCGDGERAAAPAPGGSTLEHTLVDQDGDGFLETGPGEPLVDRGHKAKLGRTLVTFGQLTDTHVRDEESPARVPFLDRLHGPFTSTFRPQEAFSAQTLDAAVRALNTQKPDAVFVTGDLTDNAQHNEIQLAMRVLKGGEADPDSGARGYRGVQQADQADPFYYRPDHDAPTHPGTLAQAQKPFRAEGLKAPFFVLPGNHDVLVQGEVPPTPDLDAIATGDRLVEKFDKRLLDIPRDEASAKLAVEHLPDLDSVHTPADPDRRFAPDEVKPAESTELGPKVEAITVDTVNRDGTSQASIGPEQLAKLAAQLQTDRWVIVFSHNQLTPEALSILDQHPNVVAAISGNTHKNRISPHNHYWLISTSSLADFPQQARMFRLKETTDGVALETWMVDHDGDGLAGVSRELAYLDAQGGRPQHFAGNHEDRNARLYLKRNQ